MSATTPHDAYGATPAGPAVEGAPSLPPRISWGAVLAGAVIALAVSITLNLLGGAIGATMIDAVQRDTPDASSFGIAGGLWMLASHLIALGIGAYAAARLSGTADGTDGTLHGLAVWGTTVLFSALLLGSVVSGAVSTATTSIGSLLGGTANGIGQVAATAGGEAADRTSTATLRDAAQSLAERAQAALTASGADPAQMSSDQRRAEIGQLAARRVTEGPLPQPEQARLAALVGAEAGISEPEAQARIQQVEQQTRQSLQQAEDRARQAADAAASAAASAAYWAFGALILGAIVAVLGARAGTRAMADHFRRR